MRYPSLKFFDRMKFEGCAPDELAAYAYALACCLGPASVVAAAWHQSLASLCRGKMRELRRAVERRLGSGAVSETLMQVRAVLGGAEAKAGTGQARLLSAPLARLSVPELLALHSMTRQRRDMRRTLGIEPCTRVGEWRIADEIGRREGFGLPGRIMLLAESLEADGYATALRLPYAIGQRPEPFAPTDYIDDASLIGRIRRLSEAADYVSRETLIEIADHVHTEIVAKGTTGAHIELVNAILNTGMPSFGYPVIARGLEHATSALARSRTKPRIDLAPIYRTLWLLTLKPAYLARSGAAII